MHPPGRTFSIQYKNTSQYNRCQYILAERPTSAASPGALVALEVLYRIQTGHLIDRSVCNQRDGIGLAVECGGYEDFFFLFAFIEASAACSYIDFSHDFGRSLQPAWKSDLKTFGFT